MNRALRHSPLVDFVDIYTFWVQKYSNRFPRTVSRGTSGCEADDFIPVSYLQISWPFEAPVDPAFAPGYLQVRFSQALWSVCLMYRSHASFCAGFRFSVHYAEST